MIKRGVAKGHHKNIFAVLQQQGINPALWKKTIAGFDDEDLAPFLLKQGDTVRVFQRKTKEWTEAEVVEMKPGDQVKVRYKGLRRTKTTSMTSSNLQWGAAMLDAGEAQNNG